MKNSRPDQRRVTITYRHDGATGQTTIVIDVDSAEDEMPHEHKKDLREMAEELLGVPLGGLGENVEVNLRRKHGDHSHPHPPKREEETRQDKKGVKT